MAPTIPNSGQATIEAFMKVKSFVSVKSPTQEEINKYDEEICSFLETVDNKKRFLNGRNSYSLGERLYTLIWYLETIPNQPITQPFGSAAKEVKVGEPDVKPNTPTKA